MGKWVYIFKVGSENEIEIMGWKTNCCCKESKSQKQKNGDIEKKCKRLALGNYEKLLCCPSFDPQITGGVADPGDVTAKVSVRH